MIRDSDLIVTMGCGVGNVCPGPFLKPTIDWNLRDPKGQTADTVREIRDQIEQLVIRLLEQTT
jgi:arsenate reductase